MTCTATDLERSMNDFVGGSQGRYRHALNRRFIYTEGVKATAELAEAYWLLDLVGLKMAPAYAKAWKAGKASVGIVTLEVFEGAEDSLVPAMTVGAALDHGKSAPFGIAARVTLELEDDKPSAFTEDIEVTDFPAGKWTFYLGTDEVGPDEYVTTMCLPQEY